MKKNKKIIIGILLVIIIALIFFIKNLKTGPDVVYKGETDNWTVKYEIYENKPQKASYVLVIVNYKNFDDKNKEVDYEISCSQELSNAVRQYTLKSGDKDSRFRLDLSDKNFETINSYEVLIKWNGGSENIKLKKL